MYREGKEDSDQFGSNIHLMNETMDHLGRVQFQLPSITAPDGPLLLVVNSKS